MPTSPYAMLFPGRKYRHSSFYKFREFSWANTLTTLTATAAIATSVVWLYPVARGYGWKGVWSYLREGDPYPPYIRERKQTLQSIATQLEQKEKTLDDMEERLKRPSLYSLDGAVLRISRKAWEENVRHGDLRKRLALLSHNLDQLAAQIDQVDSTIEIKGMKKELSNRVVKMMERADVLISIHSHA